MLKAAGFPQDSYFAYWNETLGHHEEAQWAVKNKYDGYQAAPTAQEIAYQLPTDIELREIGVKEAWRCQQGDSTFAEGATMAEALAALYIELRVAR